MSYTHLVVDLDDHVLTIVLNRPERMNAMNLEMLDELEAALRAADRDARTRVILIKGAGKAFCGGYDLNMAPFTGPARPNVLEIRSWLQKTVSRWFDIVWNHPKPIVTQVHGYCSAGGIELAIMSDITVVAEDARLGCPPTRVHGPEAVLLYPFLAGLKKAKEIMLTGDYVTGLEAVELGMANHAVPAEELDAFTMRLARRIANVDAEISALNKASLNKTFELMGLRAAMEWSADLNSLGWLTDAGVEWNQLLKDKGLRAALAARDSPFE